MTWEQLKILVNAAAKLSGDNEIVVIGSMAVLGSRGRIPDALLTSQEVDLYLKNKHEDEAASLRVERVLGAGTAFAAEWAVWVDTVGPETAKAPAGWRRRLRKRWTEPDKVCAYFLEEHDLALAKLARAGNPRDIEFVREMLVHNMVSADKLLERVSDVPETHREIAEYNLAAVLGGR